MKILLFGANGQLGSDIVRRAADPIRIHAADLPELDITDSAGVRKIVEEVRPDLVLNAAAYTDVDGAESDEKTAFAVNETGAANVAEAAAALGSRFIHISTDYVFSGRDSRPRTELDPVDPAGVYGRSKLAGERAVAEIMRGRELIVRTAWLHGKNGKNFVQTMLRLFGEKEEIHVVDDQIGNPTWTGWLAEVLLKLSDTEARGILHASCSGVVSWYDFALEIFSQAKDRIEPCLVRKIQRQKTVELKRPAPRPSYSALDNSKLEDLLGQRSMNWRDGLRGHLMELGIFQGKCGGEKC